MGDFGSNLGSGFYAKFDITTTSTSQGYIFGAQNPYVQLQANSLANGSVSNHALQFTTFDTSNNLLRGGCNAPTIDFNDGVQHTIELSADYATNTITISIDGVSQTITYDTQGTPSTFANFAGSMFIGGRNQNGNFDSPFAFTIDNLLLGTASDSLYGSYTFSEGVSSGALLVNESMASSPTTGTIKNNATWNTGGWLQLTTNDSSQNGQIEYVDNGSLGTDFTVDFDFYMGPNNTGADAIWFYFGDSATPGQEDSAEGGYHIAFDEYSGVGQPERILFNGVTLANTTGTSTYSDSIWHHGKFVVAGTTITMYLDGTQVLTYTDTTRTLGGNLFGWGGRTGGITNEHRIKNVQLSTTNPITVDSSGNDNTGILEGDPLPTWVGGSSATVEIINLVNVSETITVSEAVTMVMPDALQVSVSDNVDVSELFILGRGLVITPRENVNVTESVQLAVSAPQVLVNDTITLSESFTPEMAINTSVVDQVAVQESVRAEITSFVSTNDTVAVQESTDISPLIGIAVSDSVTVTENVNTTIVLSFSTSDLITLTESVVAAVSISSGNISDTITVSEHAVVTIEGPQISVSDNVTLIESTNLGIALNVVASDTIDVFEQDGDASGPAEVELNSFISVDDSVSVSETVQTGSESSVRVADAITISESFEYIVTPLFLSVSDTVTVTDEPEIFPEKFPQLISVSDSVTVEDIFVEMNPPHHKDPSATLIMVEGRLCYKIVEAGIPQYIYVT
jgi:hypothetical protein